MLILDTELCYTILKWIVDINALGVRLVKGYGMYCTRFSHCFASLLSLILCMCVEALTKELQRKNGCLW